MLVNLDSHALLQEKFTYLMVVSLSGADGFSIGLNRPRFNYPYDVTLNRQDHEGFGFVLVSSSTKSGAVIGLC